MKIEHKNYLLRLINFQFFLHACYYFLRALLKRVFKVFRVKRFPRGFTQIKKMREDLIKKSGTNNKINFNPERFRKSYKIKLAINFLDLSSTNDWHTKFNDDENNISIHRWNWLLVDINLNPKPIEDGLFLIRSWCSQFLNHPDVSSDAYSTGERISNSVIFFKIKNIPIPKDIIEVLNIFSKGVVENLEYESYGLTGNHAFNNARALYFASDPLESHALRKFSIAIMKERLPELISKSGLMQEGSSHYHFLFTRWVLELIWAARSINDKEALSLLNQVAKKLIERCWLFLVYDKKAKDWIIPLIGDISPDCSPQWLISLPWSKLACGLYQPKLLPQPPEHKGWSTLFGGTKVHSYERSYIPDSNFSSDCGWHRTGIAGWTLFTQAISDSGHPKASHAHLDLGGFALYYKGFPVLIDTGRFDYTNSFISNYGRSGYGHNSLFINGFSPQGEKKFWMNPLYNKISNRVRIEKKLNSVHVLISQNGFERIFRKRIVHQRHIILTKFSVEINDRINGKGTVDVQNFFHFGPNLIVQNENKNRMELSNQMTFLKDSRAKINSNNGCLKSDKTGWMHPAYGVKVPIEKLELKIRMELPGVIKNKLVLKNE